MDEEKILMRLQGLQTQTNHTILLLDTFHVVLTRHNTGTVIVMPWQTPLNKLT
jgi:hypothetical protein